MSGSSFENASFRDSFWVQTFTLSEWHEIKNSGLKERSISYKQLHFLSSSLFVAQICVPSILFEHAFFFSSYSCSYAFSKSHTEALDFNLSVLEDLFLERKRSAKAEKKDFMHLYPVW